MLDPAYRLATVMLRDHAEAEGVVHDAALRGWRRYWQLRGEIVNFRTWFLSIVARECRRTRFRHWLRSLGAGGHGLASSRDLPGAILRLRLDERAALFGFFYLDLPMDEVARVLGVSLSTARARVYRAVQRLKPHLRSQDLPG